MLAEAYIKRKDKFNKKNIKFKIFYSIKYINKNKTEILQKSITHCKSVSHTEFFTLINIYSITVIKIKKKTFLTVRKI